VVKDIWREKEIGGGRHFGKAQGEGTPKGVNFNWVWGVNWPGIFLEKPGFGFFNWAPKGLAQNFTHLTGLEGGWILLWGIWEVFL